MKKILLSICLLFLCGCAEAECESNCPVPVEQPSATATVLPTATPEPVPTPEPTPSPRPLMDAELIDFYLPEAVFGEASEQGWVSTLEYETKDYVSGSDDIIVKSMDVYKPYNYDENKQYNVLFLMHISGWDEGFWFRQSFDSRSPEGGYYGINLFDMLDKMIEQGRCAPLVVVSLDGFISDDYRAQHYSAHSYKQFHHEFANDIMPCIVENISTYAEGSSREEMSKAREHFAFLGASYGSYLNNNCILKYCYDLVSNFAFSGGGAMDYGVLLAAWEEAGVSHLPVDELYIATGLYDDRAAPEQAYLNFMKDTERFNEDNLHFTLFSNVGHEPKEWINSVYNSLQLFFR